jgi:hypothetical protein
MMQKSRYQAAETGFRACSNGEAAFLFLSASRWLLRKLSTFSENKAEAFRLPFSGEPD